MTTLFELPWQHHEQKTIARVVVVAMMPPEARAACPQNFAEGCCQGPKPEALGPKSKKILVEGRHMAVRAHGPL